MNLVYRSFKPEPFKPKGFKFSFIDLDGDRDDIHFDTLIELSHYLTKIDPDLLVNATITKLQ